MASMETEESPSAAADAAAAAAADPEAGADGAADGEGAIDLNERPAEGGLVGVVTHSYWNSFFLCLITANTVGAAPTQQSWPLRSL